MSDRLTINELRVLNAMRVRDRAQAEETESRIKRGLVRREELRDPSRCLQGFSSILSLVRDLHVSSRRKPSERETYDALQRLVSRGLVESNRVVGMGGGVTLYIRKEEPSSGAGFTRISRGERIRPELNSPRSTGEPTMLDAQKASQERTS